MGRASRIIAYVNCRKKPSQHGDKGVPWGRYWLPGQDRFFDYLSNKEMFAFMGFGGDLEMARQKYQRKKKKRKSTPNRPDYFRAPPRGEKIDEDPLADFEPV